MKLLKKILLALAAVLVIAVVAGVVIVTGIRNSGKPVYDGTLNVRGLESEVTVYRDERGMPHIYAGSEHDLYFAVGYVMAQDRLWFMDLIRRVTTGRLSEVMDAGLAGTDKFLRALEMTEKSKLVLANEDPAIISCMQAYADGVNSFVSATKKLPPEFRILGYRPEPWKLEDIANIIGYMGWDLAKDNLSSDIFYYNLARKLGPETAARLIPGWNADSSYVFPGFELDERLLSDARAFISAMDTVEALGIPSFSGSNNWAVTGARSETGKPLLSNDMHLGLSSPGIWMQMHQVIPGRLNVTGVVVPGQPFVVAGHNDSIAWGMTNLMVDDIDLFAEKINPDNPDQYYFNGEWHNMELKKEIINLKGGGKDSVVLKFTHRGPVVSSFQGIGDAALSMRWSGYDYSDEIRSVYLLNRAGNWNDFRSAISSFRSISQNFIYADVKGNIGLHTGGGIAIRKGNGALVRDGQTDEYDWKGFVPPQQLPYSFNPVSGSVSSANNRTVDDSYPYYISTGFAMPYRINRIRQMLGEKDVLSVSDFRRMLLDQHSDYAALLTPCILKLKEKGELLTATEKKALQMLEDWDYNMGADMQAPAIFEFFRPEFARNLLSDELGDLYGSLDYTAEEYYIYRILRQGPDGFVDDRNTPAEESLQDIVLRSFHDCISRLSKDYGDDPAKWLWGDIHTFTLMHPLGSVKMLDRFFSLNSEKFRVGGSGHTVSPYSYSEGFRVNHGASERHIFNTADWDQSLTVIPTGASGVPSSEFYLSQAGAYVKGEFYKDAFSEGAVKAAAKYRLVLMPGE